MLINLSDKALTVSRIAARRSSTISNSMKVRYSKEANQISINVEVPIYWARWYHYGRGPVHAKPGKVLVWFKNPKQDPRISGGYPARKRSDVRRLNKREFYEYLYQDPRPIYVRESVGPWKGDRFIPRAYAKWLPWAKETIKEKTISEIVRIFKPLRSIKKIDIPINI